MVEEQLHKVQESLHCNTRRSLRRGRATGRRWDMSLLFPVGSMVTKRKLNRLRSGRLRRGTVADFKEDDRKRRRDTSLLFPVSSKVTKGDEGSSHLL